MGITDTVMSFPMMPLTISLSVPSPPTHPMTSTSCALDASTVAWPRLCVNWISQSLSISRRMDSIAGHLFFVFPATGFTIIRAFMCVHSSGFQHSLFINSFITFGLYTYDGIFSEYIRNDFPHEGVNSTRSFSSILFDSVM